MTSDHMQVFASIIPDLGTITRMDSISIVFVSENEIALPKEGR
jgi:hypothetical protein